MEIFAFDEFHKFVCWQSFYEMLTWSVIHDNIRFRKIISAESIMYVNIYSKIYYAKIKLPSYFSGNNKGKCNDFIRQPDV